MLMVDGIELTLGDQAEKMGKFKYFPKKQRLEVRLAPGTRGLFGEVAEARLSALGSALGATDIVVKGR